MTAPSNSPPPPPPPVPGQPAASPRSEFLSGCRGIVPLAIGAVPFGIIFGTVAATSGLSIAATLGMSLFVFAGSSQFIALSLVANGTTLPLVILTTFVVNLRHLLYSVSLVPHLQKLPHAWKLPLGFWLTDEAFAVAIARYDQTDSSPYKHWYHLGSALFLYTTWQIDTLLGVTLGRFIPDPTALGLDFAMSVTFIGMIMPYIVRRSMLITVLVAGLVALLTHSLPHQLGLIVAAIAGITAGVISEIVF